MLSVSQSGPGDSWFDVNMLAHEEGEPAFNMNNDDDILWKANTANCSFLILSDLRAAFDNADHPIWILTL